MSGKIKVGPVLGFRGAKEGRWYTSALVVTQGYAGAPQLTVTLAGEAPLPAVPCLLKTFLDYYVWRLDWSVAQTDSEQAVIYTINQGPDYRYVVPELNKPLRICYGSCFGVHTLQDVNKLKNKNALWKVLRRVHQEKPYHLFFLGGDQVYADQVWEKVAPLRDWLSKKLKKRLTAEFTPEMEARVARFYFDLYLQMWSQKLPAAIISQIPTLMMWDDHDIFDGWGSYAPALQECAVFKGVYAQAREHFRVFQLQARQADDLGQAILFGQEGFTYGHRLGNLALIALDLRSERTQNQVMAPATYNRLHNWLQAESSVNALPGQSAPPGLKHLFLLAGIPIVNADLTLLESALNLRPGQQRMEDDLKDQWLSRSHQQERLRLVHRLLTFSQETGCRVTIISGDAHVAFTGYIQSDTQTPTRAGANSINQLTSSAMVNLPPPALVVYMMEKLLAGKTEKLDANITARLEIFPGTDRRILGARNWLSLTLNEESDLRAEWYVEGEEKPFTKIIQPVGN
jgi:hypothetical protein